MTIKNAALTILRTMEFSDIPTEKDIEHMPGVYLLDTSEGKPVIYFSCPHCSEVTIILIPHNFTIRERTIESLKKSIDEEDK